MSKDIIVLDVEIKREIGGEITWDDTDKVGVAVCVVYEFRTDRFRIYGDSETELVALRERVMAADEICGFNIVNFDLPVIFGQKKPAWLKSTDALKKSCLLRSNDILRRIWLGRFLNPDTFNPMTHGRAKLDDVVKRTLQSPGKLANGEQAPKWYGQGLWGPMVNYCVDDVTLERDLVVFAEKYGYIIDYNGSKLDLGEKGR